MITIYAEKFSVAAKLAAGLSGFTANGIHVTLDNVDEVSKQIAPFCNKAGYISISYEGEDYKITWGAGHLYTLKQAKDYDSDYVNWSKMPMPFFPSKYEIKIKDKIDPKTKKTLGEDPWVSRQLQVISSLFESSDYIINATDDDREGSLIFSFVYEGLNCTVPYKRLKIDSMTKSGIEHSMKTMKDSSDDYPIEQAGRGRCIADWIVGSNLTAKMSLKYGGSTLLSVGRVQTPTLAMLVKREKEIKNFVVKPFWKIEATFKTESGQEYTAKHSIAQIEKKADAEALLNKLNSAPNGTIAKIEKEMTSKEVPLLFNLSELSIAANNKYGMTAQDTLSIAQELYMAGYLTYPRTSSRYLTDDMKEYVDDVLSTLSGYSNSYKKIIESVPAKNRNYTKRHFNTKKVESHFAIIPTTSMPSKLSDRQKQIYELCAQSLIQIIFKAASIEKTKITTLVGDEEFTSNGSTIKDAQWLVFGDPSKETILPPVSEGENVNGVFCIKEGKTSPPERYTDASLVRALKTAGKTIDDEKMEEVLADMCDGGIGTEATRAGIIESVVARYATRKGKYIVPSEKGEKLIEILPVEDLKSPILTAQFELGLSQIQHNEKSLDSFIKEIEETTRKWTAEIDACTPSVSLGTMGSNITDLLCPKCGKPLTKQKWGYACSGYSKDNPESCKFAISYSLAGATLSDTDITDLVKKHRTRFIPNFVKKSDSSKFGAFLVLNDDGSLGFSWQTGFDCPCCGKPIQASSKAWSCSGYKDGCKFTIWDTIAGHKMSVKEKELLIKNGRTKLISNFVSKAGKTFAAYLVRHDDKIDFEFEKSEKNKNG